MIKIIDVSKYQIYDTSPWDTFKWGMAQGNGIRGAIFRATKTNSDGSMFVDNRLADYSANLKYLDRVGYYAYVRMMFDPVAQAEFYLNAIQYLPPARSWLDLELETVTISPTAATSRALQWLQIVEDATGIKPGVYSRASWFNYEMGSSLEWQQYPLWAARYYDYTPNLGSPWGDGKYKFRDWNTWTLWQYTDRAHGPSLGAQSQEIDVNVFNGDENKYQELITHTEQPEPELLYMRVTADLLNVRSGPGIGYADIGDLHKGDIVPVLNVRGVSAWVQIGAGQWAAAQYGNNQYLEPV